MQHFITLFYPGREIKHFFQQKPDVFVVHKNRTVFLVEVDTVEFYKKKLKKAGKGKKIYFLRFRDRISQADPYIQAYVNRNFLGDEFQDFLIRHSDVFRLDDNGFVTLASSE